MKEFDVVMLTADYEEIPAGTMGTIVQKYTDHLFEVEYLSLIHISEPTRPY